VDEFCSWTAQGWCPGQKWTTLCCQRFPLPLLHCVLGPYTDVRDAVLLVLLVWLLELEVEVTNNEDFAVLVSLGELDVDVWDVLEATEPLRNVEAPAVPP